MGIDNWPDREESDKTSVVDEPRRHMLGSFRPGRGFAPSEIDENDETLTAPIDLDLDEAPFPDDETVDAHIGHR